MTDQTKEYVADYGMFSAEGNGRVGDVVDGLLPQTGQTFGDGVHRGEVARVEVAKNGIVVVNLTDGRRILRYGLLDLAVERLDALAQDDTFAEATDTVVRDAVYEELRLRFDLDAVAGDSAKVAEAIEEKAGHVAAVDQIIASEQVAAQGRDGDVLVAVEAVADRLEEIRRAVLAGERVPSSTTGDTFFASDAARLSREIRDRQAAYDVVRKLANLRAALAKGGESR